jgi:hypothetical protein
MDAEARFNEIAADLAARNGEWVVVPAGHSDEWPRLARDALSL